MCVRQKEKVDDWHMPQSYTFIEIITYKFRMYYDRWTSSFHPAAETAVLSIDFKSSSEFLFVNFYPILSILSDGLTEKVLRIQQCQSTIFIKSGYQEISL